MHDEWVNSGLAGVQDGSAFAESQCLERDQEQRDLPNIPRICPLELSG